MEKKPPGILEFAGLGLLNALCWLGGLAAGYFVDQAIGTLPIFMFVGLLCGIALGYLVSRNEWKRFF